MDFPLQSLTASASHDVGKLTGHYVTNYRSLTNPQFLGGFIESH
jgi:hypothetical protein